MSPLHRRAPTRAARKLRAPIAAALAAAFLLLGCSSSSTAQDGAGSVDNSVAACGEGERTVSFETADGVTLVADFAPATSEDTGAVVLFHMIPPNYDRTSYPPRIRTALSELGIAVLNVDRRGAGDSGGNAGDAYEGPGALADMEAAVRFLLSEANGCTTNPERIVLVGASNGTTAVMDYTIAHANELPDPAGIVWLSPGTYTENQHSIDDGFEVLEGTPMFWSYPDNEPFSDVWSTEGVGGWIFQRLEGGRHGTSNFDDGALESQLVPALVEFVRAHIM